MGMAATWDDGWPWQDVAEAVLAVLVFGTSLYLCIEAHWGNVRAQALLIALGNIMTAAVLTVCFGTIVLADPIILFKDVIWQLIYAPADFYIGYRIGLGKALLQFLCGASVIMIVTAPFSVLQKNASRYFVQILIGATIGILLRITWPLLLF